MYVVLIPFLLAANVSTDETEPWSKGVERVFRIDVSIKALTFFNQTAWLKCRDRDASSLFCYLYDNEEDVINEAVIPFTLEFDNEGVKNITLSSSTPLETLDALKRVIGTFNLGVDPHQLSNEMTGLKEATVMGLCDSEIKVFRNSTDEETDGAVLDIIPEFEWQPGTSVKIIKNRNVNSCPKVERYLEYVKTDPEGIEPIAEDYVHEITISKSRPFKSCTTVRATFKSIDQTKSVTFEERFGIEFLRLEEAKDDIPSVTDTVTSPIEI